MNAATIPDFIRIELGEVQDLDALAILFDQYRTACGQSPDWPAARHFLFERIINHESVIYLAEDTQKKQVVGFLQLYMTFSSLAMQPVWRLSDLYVHPDARRQGLARALVHKAINLVRERGDKGLILELGPDHQAAQALFKGLGFQPDSQTTRYTFDIQLLQT